MGAEVFVFVHAQAGGNGKRFGQAPFVFGKQGPLIAVDLVGATRQLVARLVIQALAQVGAAQGQHVRAQR
ncbi:hypothetical protein D3C85_1660680 [compost metagenome]